MWLPPFSLDQEIKYVTKIVQSSGVNTVVLISVIGTADGSEINKIHILRC